MSENRASLDELNQLHAQVAGSLKGALSHQWTDEEGNRVPPPAALINVAVNFLKANGITGAAVTPKKVTDFLDEASLPFFDEAVQEVVNRAKQPFGVD